MTQTATNDEEPCGWEEVYAANGCDTEYDEVD